MTIHHARVILKSVYRKCVDGKLEYPLCRVEVKFIIKFICGREFAIFPTGFGKYRIRKKFRDGKVS